MTKPILHIFRGVPGSGKTTKAREISPRYNYCNDDYFMRGGIYHWDASKIKEAIKQCQRRVEFAMSLGHSPIAVHNTFILRAHVQPYLDLAERYGYDVVETICDGGFQNVHGVPEDRVQGMRAAFEP